MRSALVLRAASAALLTASLVSSAHAADLTISNWDAYMAPDVAQRFQEATGYEVEIVNHATNEEIMGKLMASGGRGFDLVFVSTQFVEALIAQGMAAELDHSQIPNMANLYEAVKQMPHDPGNLHSAPYTWGTTGLCYRADLVQTAPTSWNDLMDPPAELEGKTTMLATDRWLLAAALLSNGHSVNETDVDAIAEAEADLIAAKPQLLAYDDTTFYSKLISGEALMAHAWDGWCNYGIAEDTNIKFVLPEEGSDMWMDNMVIMEASENKEAAHAFINFILDAENHKWTAENILYKVPNQAAMELLDPSLLETFPNMAWTITEMADRLELLRDVGRTQRLYARTVSNVMAAQ